MEPSLAKKILELSYAGKKKISTTGKSIVFFWGKIKKSLMQSFERLQNGLEISRKTTFDSHKTPITIFNDSREALITLLQLSSYTSSPYLRNLLCRKTSHLENNGQSINIRWIPSHVVLVGHDKADQSARHKARRRGKPVEQKSLLTHIKKDW